MTDQTPFPIDALPEPMRSYVQQGAKAIGCDAAFVGVPLLAGLAGVVGNTRRLRLKRSWSVPCVVWAAVVAESGSAKSPAQSIALDAVELLERRLRLHHDDEQRKAAELADNEQGEPEPCPRVIVSDATTEVLAVLLQQNPRGLLMACDELSGWLGRLDRYSGGRGGGDRAQWLELFDARPLTVDRKTAGSVYVPRAAVSLCGGIQPGVLPRVMGKADRSSGLLARLLVCKPPRQVLRWTDQDMPADTERSMRAAVAALYDLQHDTGCDGEPTPRELKLDDKAQRLFVELHDAIAEGGSDLTGDMAACWSKLKGYLPRLALLHHLARWAGGQAGCGDAPADADTIEAVSVDSAAHLVKYFAEQAEGIYGTLEQSEADADRDELLAFIKSRGEAGVSKRQVMLWRRSRYPTAELAKRSLDQLEQDGFCEAIWLPAGSKGGQPSMVYKLLPDVAA